MTTAKWTSNTGTQQDLTLSCCKVSRKGVFAGVGVEMLSYHQ
jgi:hypothetical protein